MPPKAGWRLPAEPVLFFKATSSLAGPNDDVIIPKGASKLDWEVELALVIGRRAAHVEREEAAAHIAGFVLHNDYSERAFQLERGGQWVKGKSADTFAPLGPWLVTADEIPDPQQLADVVDGEWRDQTEEHDGEHDLRRLRAGQLRQPVHDAVAGRCDHHRHACRCRPGDEAGAAIPAAGRCGRARHRRPRLRATTGGGRTH